jgi:SAM-dependent methyltransferase
MSDDTKLGPYKRAVLAAQERAGDQKLEGEGYVLHQYPDYDTYRDVQVAGNKAKLKMQFVKESHIRILADHLTSLIGEVRFGICHGTRRGAEQAWFRAHLPGTPEVIGTEISDTALDFPDTVQWDFHDPNPDWAGRADFIYSNSWDHAFDPERAFAAWLDAMRPGGLMLLDYTKGQTPEAANALDPFGTTLEALTDLLAEKFGDRTRLCPVLDTRKTNKEYRAQVVILEKTA